jgi:hypothetical protein
LPIKRYGLDIPVWKRKSKDNRSRRLVDGKTDEISQPSAAFIITNVDVLKSVKKARKKNS